MACEKTLLKPITKDTRAVVVGAGSSGQAAVRLLRHIGAKIRVLDRNADKIPFEFSEWLRREGIAVVDGEHLPEHFIGADIVIPSPGAPISQIISLLPETNAPDIVAETELAWRFIDKEIVLAITGTSGKTTTTSLCAAMLEEQGLNVFTGGNIGTPLSEYVLKREKGAEPADVIVLELSSFQLQACQTLKPRVAILLNVSENHLDHHADMKEYVDAKMRLFRCQDKTDVAVFGASVRGLAHLYQVKARRVYFNGTENRFTQTNLFGKHNMLNAEAAYLAVKELGVSFAHASKALAEFKPIENRLEKITEHKEILFVNDSKSTTVEALRVALEAFERPVLLLAGGKFKGGDLESLRELLKTKVRAVALYGASREIFEKAWKGAVPLAYSTLLKDAVMRLYGIAKKNDVILLSPATASYDQYKNYEERGNDFRHIVADIVKEKGQ